MCQGFAEPLFEKHEPTHRRTNDELHQSSANLSLVALWFFVRRKLGFILMFGTSIKHAATSHLTINELPHSQTDFSVVGLKLAR